MAPLRLAHLSDIHITAQTLGWRREDFFSKRLTGWLNFRLLGRGYRFRSAEEVLASLVAELDQRRPDRVIFSGDATALGLESEMVRAAQLLDLANPNRAPGLAVPGNHDYYTPGDPARGIFEKYFAHWQQGERVDGAVYPFAQQVGSAWLVAVNSASGNVLPWDAGGRVDDGQLARLDRLLKTLAPGHRILVTHYPVSLASGKRERHTHGLKNLTEVVDVAARGSVCLWLHGHRHHGYLVEQSELAPFPVICAGSATQSGIWSYNEYLLDGNRLHATRRTYANESGRFEAGESFTLELPPLPS